MEIIDHLASSTEERMEADSELDFSMALQETYTSFGVLGLSTIGDAVTAGLHKKYKRFFWKTFRSFFSDKYILLLVLGGLLAYQVQLVLIANGWWLAVFTAAMLLELGVTFFKKFSRGKLGQYLCFRLSGGFLALQGALLFVIVLLKPYLEVVEPFFGLHWASACISGFLVLYIVYLIAAFRTRNLGIAESRALMKKYQYLN